MPRILAASALALLLLTPAFAQEHKHTPPSHTDASFASYNTDSKPKIRIVSPQDGEVLPSASVLNVQVALQADGIGLETGSYHVHIFIDDQPYRAMYDAGQPFAIPDLPDGSHTLQVVPSRPWHETFKNPGAYDAVNFVIGKADGRFRLDPKKPTLVYSRPKKGLVHKWEEAQNLIFDFYVHGATLGHDGVYLRMTIDQATYLLTSWSPIFIETPMPGKHQVTLELMQRGRRVDANFNPISAEWTILDPEGLIPEDTAAYARGEKISTAMHTAIPTGFAGVVVWSEDPAALVAWYEAHLGFRTTPGPEGEQFGAFAGTEQWFGVMRAGSFGRPGGGTSWSFMVPDLAGTKTHLGDLGLEPLMEFTDPGHEMLIYADPDGNDFSLVQPSSGSNEGLPMPANPEGDLAPQFLSGIVKWSADTDATAAWYHDHLGLAFPMSHGGGEQFGTLNTGPAQAWFGLFPIGSYGVEELAVVSFAIAVNDVDALKTKLAGSGIEPVHTIYGNQSNAYVYLDPEGHAFSIAQVGGY